MKPLSKDVSINRGNCPVEYKYVLNEQKHKLYAKENPDKGCFDGKVLRNKEDMEWYDNLDDKSKAVYDPIFPKSLKFGQTYTISTKCAVEDIIEVSLTVNGSKIIYSF